MSTKFCSFCKKNLNISNFGKSRGNPTSRCKECKREDDRIYREKNKDKIKERDRLYRQNNKEKIQKYKKDNYKKHKEKYKETKRTWEKNKRDNDINFRIKQNLRGRMYKSLFNNKNDTTQNLLECSIDFFKNWIEWQFNSSMTWNNYGTYWNIDHVKPCASFNLKHLDKQKECFSWKNCRPLECITNNKKNASIYTKDILNQELKVKFYIISNISKLRESP